MGLVRTSVRFFEDDERVHRADLVRYVKVSGSVRDAAVRVAHLRDIVFRAKKPEVLNVTPGGCLLLRLYTRCVVGRELVCASTCITRPSHSVESFQNTNGNNPTTGSSTSVLCGSVQSDRFEAIRIVGTNGTAYNEKQRRAGRMNTESSFRADYVRDILLIEWVAYTDSK